VARRARRLATFVAHGQTLPYPSHKQRHSSESSVGSRCRKQHSLVGAAAAAAQQEDGPGILNSDVAKLFCSCGVDVPLISNKRDEGRSDVEGFGILSFLVSERNGFLGVVQCSSRRNDGNWKL
jgi:hypothetical protein